MTDAFSVTVPENVVAPVIVPPVVVKHVGHPITYGPTPVTVKGEEAEKATVPIGHAAV
jgi:hypothetical protein